MKKYRIVNPVIHDKFDLDDNDCAIIVRTNGEIQFCSNIRNESSTQNDAALPLAGAALVLVYPEWRDLFTNILLSMSKSKNSDEDDKDYQDRVDLITKTIYEDSKVNKDEPYVVDIKNLEEKISEYEPLMKDNNNEEKDYHNVEELPALSKKKQSWNVN